MQDDNRNIDATTAQAALEVIVFEEFHSADSSMSSPEVSKRRFMTLVAEPETHSRAGGVGKVRKARNTTGETFAIKTLHRPKESPTPEPVAEGSLGVGDTERSRMMGDTVFGEEYRTQHLLSNMRGFPKLYGYGVHRGSPVLVMEWIEGVTLTDAKPQMPRDGAGVNSRVVGGIGLAVLKVLENTRTLDITVVHRDLSPNNIMLRTDARSVQEQCESGRFDVCLIDFGSSALIDGDNPRFTQATSIWRHGTPEYASPEMLSSDIPNVGVMRSSPKIDVYALSSVMYELYAGHTPYVLSRVRTASRFRHKVDNAPYMLMPRRESDTGLTRCIMEGLSARQELRPDMGSFMESLRLWMESSRSPEGHQPGYVAHGPSPYPSPQDVATLQQAASPTPPHIATQPPSAPTSPTGAESRPLGAEGSSESPAKPARRSRKPVLKVAAFLILAAGALGGLSAYASFNLLRSDATTTSVIQESQTAEEDEEAAGEDSEYDSFLESYQQEAEKQKYVDQGRREMALEMIETVPYTGQPLHTAVSLETEGWGFKDDGDNWVIKPVFPNEPTGFSDGLSCCRDPETRLYGYISPTGEWVIKPQFLIGRGFREGLACAVLDRGSTGADLYGVIDTKGNWVVQPQFSYLAGYSNGLCAANKGGESSKTGFIDRTGNLVIDYQFRDAGDFSDEGLARATIDNKDWGFIDKTGKWAIPATYALTEGFSEGYAAVCNSHYDGRWAYIDPSGNRICNFAFREVKPFQNGSAWVRDESGHWGQIDYSGNWVVQPSWDNSPPA